jgi:hypothetical protein
MYPQAPHANASLTEPKSKLKKNDNITVFFIIWYPYLFR